MRVIRHGKLPIKLVSEDRLTYDMLNIIEMNMSYNGWEYWVDEYGEWFNPHKPNPNQLEIPFTKES
tara:strand:- start:196 stop:393 length:198 start_codon:yes stop_codon:yes gene_type:complete